MENKDYKQEQINWTTERIEKISPVRSSWLTLTLLNVPRLPHTWVKGTRQASLHCHDVLREPGPHFSMAPTLSSFAYKMRAITLPPKYRHTEQTNKTKMEKNAFNSERESYLRPR